MHTEFTAKPRLLVAAKGQCCIQQPVGVDPHRSRFQLPRNCVGFFHIACPDWPPSRTGCDSPSPQPGRYRRSSETASTGPKISSCAIFISLLTPRNIVGSINNPAPPSSDTRFLHKSALRLPLCPPQCIPARFYHLILADNGAHACFGIEGVSRLQLFRACHQFV